MIENRGALIAGLILFVIVPMLSNSSTAENTFRASEVRSCSRLPKRPKVITTNHQQADKEQHIRWAVARQQDSHEARCKENRRHDPTPITDLRVFARIDMLIGH
jgi:hypothetical protein